MSKQLSRDVRVAAVAAAFAAVVAAPTGAMAAYVANADHVDHKDAVGAEATVSDRAGKLVATKGDGTLPNNIITKAPNSKLFGGLPLRQVQTQWLSVAANGTIHGASAAASDVVVTHPAAGTYCVSSQNIVRDSVSGNVQSQVNGFEDLTMVVTSLYNTSACPNDLRIYTALDGTLHDTPFTLTFVRTE